MPTRDIIKLYYKFVCLKMAVDNLPVNSYNSFLH